MRRKAVSGIILILLFTDMLILINNVQPVKISTVSASPDVVRASVLIEYGNGSESWFDRVALPPDSTVLNATIAVAAVNYTIYESTSTLVEAINDVWNTNPYYWTWWYWNFTQSEWIIGPQAPNHYVLGHLEIIAWYYENVEIGPLPPSSPPSRMITVDDDGPADFHAIQEAINAARDKDTILVYNGTYYENIVVNKNIVVAGQNSDNTFIDGNDQPIPSVVSIVAANVTVMGFTIRKARVAPSAAGIRVESVLLGLRNVTISGNVFSDNIAGIELHGANNNTICDNIFSNNTRAISLASSDTNSIIYNTIFNNSGGLDIAGSYNHICDNIFANTSNSGIYLAEGHANVVRSNLIASGGCGVQIGKGEGNIIVENTIVGNRYGIYWYDIGMGGGNLVYHNDFINNTIQVLQLTPSTPPPWPYQTVPNRWDNGYPVGGNYWNDYGGTDIYRGIFQNETGSDGIGDTPYNITERGLFVSHSQDRYPLMHPWSSLPVHNINTGLGYRTIQEAINSPETLDGHTVFVESGTYYENVAVNKTLSLIGEDREATIIDGNGSANAVTVLSNGTSISSFTLQAPGFWTYALDLENVSDTTIVNNTLTNSYSSLSLRSSNFNTIMNNNIAPGSWRSTFGNSSHNTLIGNNIGGLYFTSSSNNTLIGNTIGFLWLWFSSNTRLRDNNLSYFEVDGNINLHYIQDIDPSNTLNGKPIYYWVNHKNVEVPPDAGYVALIDCANITVRGSNFENNFQSILMLSTDNSRILNNNVTSIFNGIWISSSSSNIICGNSVANGTYGIQLLDGCSGNNVYGNNIRANGVGIWLVRSSNNNIFNNNLINNRVQVDSYKSINTWDARYPSGGNFWSNYKGFDLKSGLYQNETGSDGIGDVTHTIDANNTDNYPLMGMFSDFNATSEYSVQIICNSTISDFLCNGTAIGFNVAGVEGTTGFCRICIPTALINETYHVFVNGTEVSCNLLPWSNSTHSYLYFNYTHSTQKVIIIPEFSPFPVLIVLVFSVGVAIGAESKTKRRES